MNRADIVDEMATDGAGEPDGGVDYKDLYLRTLADFDNYRKRIERERDDIGAAGRRDLLLELVDVMDNFERAVDVVSDGSADRALAAGVVAIYRQLRRLLESNSVQPFESVGHRFDPEAHEAVGVIASDTVPEGSVADELRPGYTYRGKLLRPARVVVSTGPAE